MVKQLFALIKDHVSIPTVASLPATLPRGGIAIDVASLYSFLKTRHTLLEDMKRDFKRMALFCLEREFPVIMVVTSIHEKAHEKTSNHHSEQQSQQRQLKKVTTRLGKIKQEIANLEAEWKQDKKNLLTEAKLIVSREKEKRLREQEKYLVADQPQQESKNTIEQEFISFFRSNEIPFIEDDNNNSSFLALMLQDKVKYIATEDNSHLVNMALMNKEDKDVSSSYSLLRNFVWHVRSPKKFHLYQYEMPRILDEMKVSALQFLDMCFLLGFRGISSIPGIGKKRIYTAISKHGSIEKFLTIKNFVDKKTKDSYFKKMERIKWILQQEYENAKQIKFEELDKNQVFDFPLLIMQNIQKHESNKFRKTYRVVQVEYI